jgi:hypothetical protein
MAGTMAEIATSEVQGPMQMTTRYPDQDQEVVAIVDVVRVIEIEPEITVTAPAPAGTARTAIVARIESARNDEAAAVAVVAV